MHTKNFRYKGYHPLASEEDQQYEIKSHKSDHIAAHKARALTKLAKED
ncbi:DUF2945 domain-containing protein [Haoranjiania flava]|uniref:DUF2945 domain-containing protein n=1 Tax=Haoranjiania flava TaxID=1856322 RepID=A0AAE3IN04_9BACT|nr:DUF2945 domain-containing protein [Haoranjiania flava]MCU7695077.1 DUF2945 domain-containing protein [Haoranjiania flava]